MAYISLDLSTKTGWAAWWPGDVNALFSRPDWLATLDRLGLARTSKNWTYFGSNGGSLAYGRWLLRSEWSKDGAEFDNLHLRLADLYEAIPFEAGFYERAINLHQGGNTSARNIEMALGLQAHAISFGIRFRLRFMEGIDVNSWRPDFIGRDENKMIKRAAKAAEKSARDPLKAATMERCRQLGFAPRNTDEGDAIGILTYGLLARGITPPWIADEALRPMLTEMAP